VTTIATRTAVATADAPGAIGPLGVAALPKDAHIEIDAIVALGR
jgi:hypothetical protein